MNSTVDNNNTIILSSQAWSQVVLLQFSSKPNRDLYVGPEGI